MNKLAAASLALLGLTACTKSPEAGAIRGRVLTPAGQPAAGARVMLDSATGRTTLANAHGEFRLGGAISGGHKVFALSNHSAALANASVAGTATSDVGDLVLEDCGVIVSQGGTPTGGGTSNGGTTTTGGTASGAPSPAATAGQPNVDPNGTMPCQVDPPPPPPDHVNYDAINADYADASLDPSGIYGFAWDSSAGVGFDFWLSGDFTTPGTYTVHVDGAAATDPGVASSQGSVWLYTQDGYAYLLSSGDLTLTTTAVDGGTPSPTPVGTPDSNGGPMPPVPAGGATMAFTLHAENLNFDYFTWDGTVDPTHTATVGTADASGNAWVWTPPQPPAQDYTIDTLTADSSQIYLCPACATDGGDSIYLFAYDSTHGADLSFSMPVSALGVPGAVTLDATSPDVYGSADYFGDGSNYWYYSMAHATITIDSTAITSGAALTIHVSNAQFDFADSYGGGVIVGGGPVSNGGVTAAGSPTDPPAAQFHLFIGSGDLSGTVDGFTCGGTTPNGGGVATTPI